MNYLKSGWSFLSSSFTQSEGEAEAALEDTDDSFQLSENAEPPVVALNERRNSLDSNDDLTEFTDAIDSPSDRNDVQATGNSITDSQEIDHLHEIGKQSIDIDMTTTEQKSIKIVAESEAIVDEIEETSDKTMAEASKGYTSLEASDSDDSDEVIPPPAAPVGNSVDTDTQLNQIIKNLGGDLDILTLDDENAGEVTLGGEKTFGETLYLTAYDQTILPSSPGESSSDSFSATAIEADLNAQYSPDSAIASSSKSSTASGDYINLNFNTKSDLDDLSDSNADENLNLILKEKSFQNITAEDSTLSITLDTTVREVVPADNISLNIQDINTQDITNTSEFTTEPQSVPVPTTEEKDITKEQNNVVSSSEKSPAIEDKPIADSKKMDENQVDEIPISRGAYTIDFENLDTFNPFACNKGMLNSPEKPAKTFAAEDNVIVSKSCPEDHAAMTYYNHKEIEQELPNKSAADIAGAVQMENETAQAIPITNGIDSVGCKTPEISKIKEEVIQDDTPEDSQETLPSKSSYRLDLDNLDNIDPFKTGKGLQNSPEATIPAFGYGVDLDNMGDIDPFQSKKTLSFSPPKSPVKNNVGLLKHMNNLNEEIKVAQQEVITEKEPVDIRAGGDAMAMTEKKSEDITDNLENVAPLPEKPAKKLAKKPVLGANRKKANRPVKKKPSAVSDPQPATEAPEDDIIAPKGAYTLDFDKLESLDPFKTSKGLCNSPTKTAPEGLSDAPLNEDIFNSPEKVSVGDSSPVDPPIYPLMKNQADEQDDIANEKKDEWQPINDELEEAKKQEPQQGSEAPQLDEKLKKKAEPLVEEKLTKPMKKPDEVSEDVDEIPISKGAYNLDFDNLDNINPFKTSKGLANSPTDEVSSSGFTSNFGSNGTDLMKNDSSSVPAAEVLASEPKVEASIPNAVEPANITEDTKEKTVAEAPVSVKPNKKTELARKKVGKPSVPKSIESKPETVDLDEIPITKGAYNLDFDNLDSIDPFKTSKGLSNSPTEDAPAVGFSMSHGDPVVPVKMDTSNITSTMTDDKPAQEPKQPEETVVPEPKEPEKTIGPKSPANRKIKKKSGLARKKLIKPSVAEPMPDEEEEMPVPRGAYNLDFDNLDNINPFQTAKGLPNSPTKDAPAAPGYATGPMDIQDPFKSSNKMANSPTKTAPEPLFGASTQQSSNSEVLPNSPTKDAPAPGYTTGPMDIQDPFKSSNKMANSPTKTAPEPFFETSTSNSELLQEEVEEKKLISDESQKQDNENVTIDPFKPSNAMRNIPNRDATSVNSVDEVDPGFQTALDTTSLNVTAKEVENLDIKIDTKPMLDYRQEEQMEFARLNENEEFYPASAVFQDSAPLDFLDSLGDKKPFTESALRKQSLYVKFDPLVSGSPLKQLNEQTVKKDIAPVPTISVQSSTSDKQVADTNESQAIKTKNPEIIPTRAKDNKQMMDPFNQPYLSQQSYQTTSSTTLKYTQTDFDSILKKSQQEWEDERKQSKNKQETLTSEVEQMKQVVKEYEQLINELSSNWDENGTLTRGQQLMKAEHEQALEDMAALERSHDDLCRRYNKLKTVVSQFKQNEEILKTSTNEMMEEAKATEKKYLTLKVKAEREIAQANSELHHVTSNAQQEVARANAQVKMLELKCESLQSQIRDCNKENEELTKLCDELISKQS